MLRITKTQDHDAISLKLEGSLRGPWVSELESAWQQCASVGMPQSVQVDLADLSFADFHGRKILLDMKNAGAILTGASTFMRHLLDEKVSDSSGLAPENKEI